MLKNIRLRQDEFAVSFFRCFMQGGQHALFQICIGIHQYGPPKFPEQRHGVKYVLQIWKSDIKCGAGSKRLYVFFGRQLFKKGKYFAHDLFGRIKRRCYIVALQVVRIGPRKPICQEIIGVANFSFFE